MQRRMDDDMQAMEVRDREMERRLESYARARLSPNPQAVARARARVLREARLQFEASRIAVHMAPTIGLAARSSMVRRLALPLLAASVWLGITVGSISAAQAGGPLYPTRMWVENATLPSAGAARASAELDRLDARLAEAITAAAGGDSGGVQAALNAYRQIADDTMLAATGDQPLEARVAAALDQHRAVLTAVAARLQSKDNDRADAAVEASIQRAIDHNQAVVDTLGASRAGGTGGTTGGPASNPGDAGGGNGGTGAGAGATATDGSGTGGAGSGSDGKPDKSPKPTPIPTPVPTTRPAPKPTPAPTDPHGPPDHSPRGQNG